MSNLDDLHVKIQVDDSELERTTRRATMVGSAIGNALGSLATKGIDMALGAISDFAIGGVDRFAAVEDAAAAAGVIFGDSFSMIEAQAEGAASSLGLSKGAAIDASNTFGVLGKSAGKSGTDLAEFATGMTSLAGDLASFRGTSPEQAIEAIGAALRGESEPIRAYGVLLDDATLKQRALSMGLISTTKDALTPQQKALAAQAEILAQTTDAQGDFARTNDSTANTAKRLAAEYENASAELGEKLAPAMTWAKERAIDLLGGVGSLSDGIGTRLQGAFDLFTTGDFNSEVGEALGGVEEDSPLVTGILGLRDHVDKLKAGFQLFTTGDFSSEIGEALGGVGEDSPLVNGILTVRETIDSLKGSLQTVADAITSQVKPTWDSLVALFQEHVLPIYQKVAGVLVDQVLPAVQSAASQVSEWLAPKLEQLGVIIREYVFPAIGMFLDALGWIVEHSGPVITIVGFIISTLWGIYTSMWDVATGVFGAVEQIIGTFKDWGENVAVFVTDWKDRLVGAGQAVWDFVQAIWSGLQAAWGAITGWVSSTVASILGWAANLVAGAQSAMGGMLSAISSAAGGIIGAVSGVVSGGVAAVGGFVGSMLSKGRELIGAVGDGIRNAASSVYSAVSGAVSSAVGAVSGLWNSMYNAGYSIIQAVGSGIRSAFSSVYSAVSSGLSSIRNLLPFSPAKEGPFSGRGWSYYSGQSIMTDLGRGISARAASAAGEAREAMGGVVDQLAGSAALDVTAGGLPGPAGGAGRRGRAVAWTAAPVVRVYIGERELTDIVRVEVDAGLDDLTGTIESGAVA